MRGTSVEAELRNEHLPMQFEKWILTQQISAESGDLFAEAIVCFKASAYRASLLLSYLAFLTILKDRMLSPDQPSGFSESQWQSITEKLLNDDKWDTQAYNATQSKPPRSVFEINDDLRGQVAYWKNRRNDCAHSKRNAISYAHVEAFWQFIGSNLAKFVVRGSVEGLLSELRVHFDRSQTPAGASYEAILNRISEALESTDLPAFFESVFQIFQDRRDHVFDTYSQEELELFSAIFRVNSEDVTEGLRRFLLAREALLLEVLRADPSIIHHFSADARFVRHLWYDQLFARPAEDYYPLYVSLLRNNLIPEIEVAEAHARIIPRLYAALPSDDEFKVLSENGFIDVFRKVVFDDRRISNFNWANYNTTLIIKVLRELEIDEGIVESLAATFSVENHPWDLRRDLNAYIQMDEELQTELREAFRRFNVRMPKYLDSLTNAPEVEDEIPF